MRRVLIWIFFFLSLLAGFSMRYYYAGDWFDYETDADGEIHAVIYQVEADAYARLARVQRILQGHGLIQNFHPQENYPDGIKPTTTFPFDLPILALYFPIHYFTAHALDWAGALVSPALYFALAIFIFWWSQNLTFRTRVALLFGIAAMPALVWATPFARPDHQSLDLVLFAAAFCLEWNRWREGNSPRAAKIFAIVAGILWGIAMWDSLYEPLLLFVIVVGFNLAMRRREQPGFLIAAIVILAISFCVEGLPLDRPPREFDPYLVRWLGTIAEVRPMSMLSATIYFSPALWVVPLFIFRYLQLGPRKTEDWLLAFLSVVLIAITFTQTRWFYFTGFVLLLLMAGWCEREKIVWLRRVALVAIVYGLMWGIDYDLNKMDQDEKKPTPQLRHIALSIDGPGGILAPWWLSPALLYYSGQPIVAGSSHMTIPGIVDTARYFTTNSWVEGDQILQKRHIRWVVVYLPERLIQNSQQILGTEKATDSKRKIDQPITASLYEGFAVPTRYRLRAVEQDCKLYEYDPSR